MHPSPPAPLARPLVQPSHARFARERRGRGGEGDCVSERGPCVEAGQKRPQGRAVAAVETGSGAV
eukprot:2537100-Rhodomonas_salina.5